MAEQLIKKTEEGYSNVMPKSWIEAITDKSTGESLTHILQGFNMYFLSYTGSTEQTRCQVSKILRRKGLWITYVKYDGNVYTEWYNSNNIDDKSWGNSSNWRVGNNELVGDLTISANGNWVINGKETEFKAIGEKGNTPLIRIADNKLQVSYDRGDTYNNVSDNPVYTKFRWQSSQNDNVGNIQFSIDGGKTWKNFSSTFVNNLHIAKYIGANETLPTSGMAEGTIYAKGPTYADSDTSHSNPIYRLWVYAYKGNTLAWQDNGEFTSINAGITQELGNSKNLVISQKVITEHLNEIEQNNIYFFEDKKLGYVIQGIESNTDIDYIEIYQYINRKTTSEYLSQSLALQAYIGDIKHNFGVSYKDNEVRTLKEVLELSSTSDSNFKIKVWINWGALYNVTYALISPAIKINNSLVKINYKTVINNVEASLKEEINSLKEVSYNFKGRITI